MIIADKIKKLERIIFLNHKNAVLFFEKNIKNYFNLFLRGTGIRMLKISKNFPLFFLKYYTSKANKKISIVLQNGVKYKIRNGSHSTDRFIAEEIWTENVYQIDKNDLSPEKSIVIDIGAHIGIFSIFIAYQGKNTSIYSFEPEPNNFNLLLGNIKINNLKNRIHPYNLAVSGKNETKQLIRSQISLARHSFFNNKFLNNNKTNNLIDVPCVTLSSIFEKNKIDKCDILKLDCEGSEYDILLNTPRKFLSKIKKITAEYHDGVTNYNYKDLVDFLEKMGFDVKIKKLTSINNHGLGFLYATNKFNF